jgi:hypothetical protein
VSIAGTAKTDVARILHDTNSMLALPGRQYDLKRIGWQQEHWRLGPGANGRGVGSHSQWLPCVSANHLYRITSLEEYDPAPYKNAIQAGGPGPISQHLATAAG